MFQMLGFFACIALGIVIIAYSVTIFYVSVVWNNRISFPAGLGIIGFLLGCGVLYFCYVTSPYQVILK